MADNRIRPSNTQVFPRSPGWALRNQHQPWCRLRVETDMGRRSINDFQARPNGAELQAAASRIRFAVSCGRASMATWLALTSIVFALIAFAMARSRLGGMARSCFATRYQLGFVFHAAADTLSPKAPAAVGACAANRTSFSVALRS